MLGPKQRPVEERFANNLVKGCEDECWGWTGPTNQYGIPPSARERVDAPGVHQNGLPEGLTMASVTKVPRPGAVSILLPPSARPAPRAP
jgi:hypothetical protein